MTLKKLQHPIINWFRENKKEINYSMNQLYDSIGISKQAVRQYARRQTTFDNRLMQLMEEAETFEESTLVVG